MLPLIDEFQDAACPRNDFAERGRYIKELQTVAEAAAASHYRLEAGWLAGIGKVNFGLNDIAFAQVGRQKYGEAALAQVTQLTVQLKLLVFSIHEEPNARVEFDALPFAPVCLIDFVVCAQVSLLVAGFPTSLN